MINIPNISGSRPIIHWLYGMEDVPLEDQTELKLLTKVCTCYLHNPNHNFTIDQIEITAEDKQLISERKYIASENKEVKARFIDVSLRCGMITGSERLDQMKLCSDCYMELFEDDGDVEYFVRSILVRAICKIYTEEFFNRIISNFKNRNLSAKWLSAVSERLLKNNGGKTDTSFFKSLFACLADMEADKDFSWKGDYIDLKHDLKVYSDEEWHWHSALNYEAQADVCEALKEPNTFYPNNHEVYQKAFNEISFVQKQYPDEYKRIHDKCVASKKDFIKMLSYAGVKIRYEVPVDLQKHLRQYLLSQMKDVKDSRDIIIVLLKLPMFPAIAKIVKHHQEALSKKDVLQASMTNTVQLDNEGNKVGQSCADGDLDLNVHRQLRITQLFAIWTAMNLFSTLHYEVSEECVMHFLLTKKSKYVCDDDLEFWVKGITYILNGDYLAGTYMLMPQIERIIHNLAESKLGDLTKLAEEIQEEPTFGRVLGKIKKYIPEEKYAELDYMFINGVDVNLRNRMMHGLIRPFEVMKYSGYVLYISLRLFYHEDIFLFEAEKE